MLYVLNFQFIIFVVVVKFYANYSSYLQHTLFVYTYYENYIYVLKFLISDINLILILLQILIQQNIPSSYSLLI